MTIATTPPVPQEDNLAQDLVNMLTKLGMTPMQQEKLLNELVPYIVERDHKILSHGYQSGRASV